MFCAAEVYDPFWDKVQQTFGFTPRHIVKECHLHQLQVGCRNTIDTDRGCIP